MQSQTSAHKYPTTPGKAVLLSSPVDGPLSDRQLAELREAWLEHQVNPPRKLQTRGVPYSALND